MVENVLGFCFYFVLVIDSKKDREGDKGYK